MLHAGSGLPQPHGQAVTPRDHEAPSRHTHIEHGARDHSPHLSSPVDTMDRSPAHPNAANNAESLSVPQPRRELDEQDSTADHTDRPRSEQQTDAAGGQTTSHIPGQHEEEPVAGHLLQQDRSKWSVSGLLTHRAELAARLPQDSPEYEVSLISPAS